MKLPPRLTERLGFSLLSVAAFGALYSLYSTLRPEKMLTIAVRQGVESVALKKVAERYSREYGVTVRIQEFPYDALFDEERKQVAEPHSAFDVILVDDPWMPALLIDPDGPNPKDKSTHRLKKLEKETYGQDEGLTDFVESTLEVARYCADPEFCADYYGVPFVGNSQLFCYKVADFPQPQLPQTWEGVKKASENPKKEGLGYVTRIGPNNSIVTDFMPILWSYDKTSLPVRPNSSTGAFGSQKDAARAFQSMVELVSKQKGGSASFDDFDVAAYLAKGKASMGIVWSAWAMLLANVERTHRGQTLKCAGMPGDQPELGVWLLAIPKTASMQDEAEEFIRYATSREQILIAASEGNPPPRRSVLNIHRSREGSGKAAQDSADQFKRMSAADYKKYSDLILEKYDDLFPSQLKSLESARPRPRTTCWTRMEQIIGQHLRKLIIADPESLSKAAAAGASDADLELQPFIERCQVFPSAKAVAVRH